jgi:hypothetical protein
MLEPAGCSRGRASQERVFMSLKNQRGVSRSRAQGPLERHKFEDLQINFENPSVNGAIECLSRVSWHATLTTHETPTIQMLDLKLNKRACRRIYQLHVGSDTAVAPQCRTTVELEPSFTASLAPCSDSVTDFADGLHGDDPGANI